MKEQKCAIAIIFLFLFFLRTFQIQWSLSYERFFFIWGSYRCLNFLVFSCNQVNDNCIQKNISSLRKRILFLTFGPSKTSLFLIWYVLLNEKNKRKKNTSKCLTNRIELKIIFQTVLSPFSFSFHIKQPMPIKCFNIFEFLFTNQKDLEGLFTNQKDLKGSFRIKTRPIWFYTISQH